MRAQASEGIDVADKVPSASSTAGTATVDSELPEEVKISAPEGFVAPEPKRFTVAEGSLGSIAASSLSLLLRAGTGVFVQGYSASLVPEASWDADNYSVTSIAGRNVVEKSSIPLRNIQPIVLYEFEGCPFCKKVREMVAFLDLDVLFYPCPANGPTFRPKAIELGGKKQFPYLVDPNTGVSMYESNEIIIYLAEKYGDGTIPLTLRLGPITDITAGLSNLGRISKGSRYVPAKMPPQPLEVWAYEPSPFCKVVREALCELELPHIYHSTARGSAKRDELFKRLGRFQVPYIEDPNTGIKMFESASIVDYLYATYAIKQTAASPA